MPLEPPTGYEEESLHGSPPLVFPRAFGLR